MKKLFWILALGAALGSASCDDEDTKTPEPTPVPDGEISLAVSATEALPAIGGEVEVTVTSNGDWRVIGPQEWSRPSAVEGVSGDKVVFSVDPNDGDTDRSVVYKFFTGNKTVAWTLSQQAGEWFDIVSDLQVPMGVAGGNFFVRTAASETVDIAIQEDAAGWISIPADAPAGPFDPTGSQALTRSLEFDVAANETFVGKTGHIVLTAAGEEYTITVTQDQTDMIRLVATPGTVLPEGGDLAVQLESNIDYTVEIPEGVTWLEHKSSQTGAVDPQTGLTARTETFSMGEAKFARDAEVTFRGVDSAFELTVKISQEGSIETIYTNIPDAQLRNWLSGQGYIAVLEGDYCQLLEPAYTVTSISNTSSSITNTTGIGAFPALETLTLKAGVTTVVLGDHITKFIASNHYSSGTLNITVSGGALTTLELKNYYYARLNINVTACPVLSSINVSGAYSGTPVITLSEDRRGNEPSVTGSKTFKYE